MEVGVNLRCRLARTEGLSRIALIHQLFVEDQDIQFSIALRQPNRLNMTFRMKVAGKLCEPALKALTDMGSELEIELVALVGEERGRHGLKLAEGCYSSLNRRIVPVSRLTVEFVQYVRTKSVDGGYCGGGWFP